MSEAARKTRQREAIREAIAGANVPIGPKEILDAAGERVEGLGLATVYRTLKLLVEAGEILPVEIAGESARYELAGKGHHHHFRCKGCGKVFELEGCCGHFEDLAPRGFDVQGHDLTLFGRCAGCSKGAKSTNGARASKPHVHKHAHNH
jgi:Fur family ferric uptake transcriptional regulator